MVVDTSALLAILFEEKQADACDAALQREERLAMSAVTLAEALIVAARRGYKAEMAELLAEIGPDIFPADEAAGRRAAATYDRWGKGVHPAALNIVDCFSYDAAISRGLPLLFVGDDFARTDVRSAL